MVSVAEVQLLWDDKVTLEYFRCYKQSKNSAYLFYKTFFEKYVTQFCRLKLTFVFNIILQLLLFKYK